MQTRADSEYATVVKKLSSLVKRGKAEKELYEAALQMLLQLKARGKLHGIINPSRVVNQALKTSDVGGATYDNSNLRRQPRRLIFDTRPTPNEKLSAKDRADMYKNASQICNNAIPTHYIKNLLHDVSTQVFFARNSDKTIVSFVIVDPKWRGEGYIYDLRIAEINLICAQRGRGMELMKSVINYYAGLKYDIVRLEAVPRAIPAYKKFGFKSIGLDDESELLVMMYSMSYDGTEAIKKVKKLKRLVGNN